MGHQVTMDDVVTLPLLMAHSIGEVIRELVKELGDLPQEAVRRSQTLGRRLYNGKTHVRPNPMSIIVCCMHWKKRW